MALPIKDANNLTTALKTTEAAGQHTPHHNVDSLPSLVAGSAVIGRVGLQVAGADLGAGNPIPVSFSWSGFTGLTDAQLRATAVTVSGDVRPKMNSGGILNATTANPGSGWTAFASQACTTLGIINATGTTLEFRQGGTGATFFLPDGTGFYFDGIANCNQIEVRRQDQSNTQVVVRGRWLA